MHRSICYYHIIQDMSCKVRPWWTGWHGRERRLGVEAHKVEVRFERLAVEADVRVGSRAVPTLLNSAVNAAQVITTRRTPPPSSSSCFIYVRRRSRDALVVAVPFVALIPSLVFFVALSLFLVHAYSISIAAASCKEFSFFFFSRKDRLLSAYFLHIWFRIISFVGKIEIKRAVDLVRHVEWIVLPS